MYNPLSVDSPPPNIPMPAVFDSVNSWSYSGSPFVTPAMNAKGDLLAELTAKDPDVIVIPSPDRVQIFDTPPSEMQYVLLPPPRLTKTDPTGMKAMMEFLGFKREYVAAGAAGLDSNFPPQVEAAAAPGSSKPGVAVPGVASVKLPVATPNLPATATQVKTAHLQPKLGRMMKR